MVSHLAAEGSTTDVTRKVTFEPANAAIVNVTPQGQIIPIADGKTELVIRLQDQSISVPIEVTAFASPPAVSFRKHIIPILSKAGCNAGGCHGKAEGQQGFKLSVFGYDAQADYEAIVLNSRGRRVFPASPVHSLIRQKAVANIPHGGGKKIEVDSLWDRLLLRWIAEGAHLDADLAQAQPENSSNQVTAEGLHIEPTAITLPALGQQQLRVTYTDDTGKQTCVTADAQFQSNEDSIAVVDPTGLIRTTENPGEAAILVRYLGKVAVCRVTRPREERSEQLKQPNNQIALPVNNFIDQFVGAKLAKLKIQPSPLADDATFLRRVYLDAIGTLPTAQETQDFLADGSSDKRSQVIRQLLNRNEYADFWAQRWADLLQVDKDTIPPASAVAMTRWVRSQIADNVPYDQFVRSILTAEGSILNESPAPFFQVHSDPEKLARSISQLFLGVRIECAQCHHHPLERWDQKDYYALAGFFTGIERKTNPLTGIKIVAAAGTDLNHPRTKTPVPTAALGAEPASVAGQLDRRQLFAACATQPENPYFAKLIANRIWAHYMGRGLIEPLDDIRDTNPASNEELLDALVKHLLEVRFDLKRFTQTVLESNAYQLSTQTNDSNQLDQQNYSHARWKPIAAEVLLDAVSQVTGIPEEFNGWPRGYRAIQIWDNKLPSNFFEVFGRPRRLTVCACERGSEPSMEQALHLMNATATADKISHPDGQATVLAKSSAAPAEIITQLYLSALARPPTAAEQSKMQQYFDSTATRQEAIEDVIWVLLNTKEFVFNH